MIDIHTELSQGVRENFTILFILKVVGLVRVNVLSLID